MIEAWRTGEPCYQPNTPAGGKFHAGYALLDVPFSHGTLAINAKRPDAFGARDIQIVQNFANVVSAGFQRYLDLIGRQADQQALQQAHDALAASNATLEKRVEQRTAALVAAQAQLHLVLMNAPVVVWALDAVGRLTLIEGRGLELVRLRC